MHKIDILNREAFVDQLVEVLMSLSEHKSSTCFALNGAWGSGKSFVLDMLEEKLQAARCESTETSRFFVIRYNCWKYDYYEEPLIAIVAALIDIIETQTRLFSDDEMQRTIIGTLKAVGAVLWSMGSDVVREKTGVDFEKLNSKFQEIKEDAAVSFENNHSYDIYFSFKQVIGKLKDVLQCLSKDYTVVFLVDELDRCLPEYAVKVLERLHHITEDAQNFVTVVSIDKTNLISSVKRAFGFDEPEKYLEKFINFEVKLDYGTVSEKLTEKYAEYMSLFDKSILPFEERLEEFFQAIFKDVEIRTQEQLVKKAMLAHRLLYNQKKDYSFMCMEIMLAVLICVYKDEELIPENRKINISFNNFFGVTTGSQAYNCGKFFEEKIQGIQLRKTVNGISGTESYNLPEELNLYGAILYTWCHFNQGHATYNITRTQGGVYEPIANNHKELESFINIVKMIS